jgi:hypothetical protein
VHLASNVAHLSSNAAAFAASIAPRNVSLSETSSAL